MNTVFDKKIPIHFFTIVLNGMPFIEYHLKEFLKLDIPWRWHIVEGVAALNHDTSWSVASGGQITEDIHDHGLSNDSTSSYLDSIQRAYPNQIFIYRKKRGFFWDGKKEMVSAPLKNINEKCLLWQVDADELWTQEQINNVHTYFQENPEKSAAFYWCWYFVGPNKIISTRFNYAQNPNQEWLRTWKYIPGDQWIAHEPPTLMREINKEKKEFVDIAKINPISHAETEKIGAVFQHYAYVTEAQIKFKESYYGYKNALNDWCNLQNTTKPGFLSNYFKWVTDQTIVDDASNYPLLPIALQDSSNKQWIFDYETDTKQEIKPKNQNFKIAVDGIFWQYQATGIARVWKNILLSWVEQGYADQVIVFDRCGTAPRIEGVHYWTINKHSFEDSAGDSIYLQELCDQFNLDYFISTYYTTPTTTPSFFMGYDMIPEILDFPLEDQTWKEKNIAILLAQKYGMISNNSIQDLIKIYPHLDPLKISHLPLGVDPDIFRSSDAEIADFLTRHGLEKQKFILLVGERLGYCGYKNSGLVIKALSLYSELDFSVLCIGGQEFIEDELIKLNPNIKIQRIKATDIDLRAAYSSAYCLIYPSKYEGFGLPPLEAMACGCPVITCKNSSLIEVVGDAAIFVDDSDPTQTFEAIESLKSIALREDLIRRGNVQVEKFEFKSTSNKLFESIISININEPFSKEYVAKIIKSFRLNQQLLQTKLNFAAECSIKNNIRIKTLEIEIEKSCINEITKIATTNPEILLDRITTKNLIWETGKRITQYPLRKIKKILPSGVEKLIKKLLNYR
jgi:glycosyltransferase involved in cell wall biosynthesis